MASPNSCCFDSRLPGSAEEKGEPKTVGKVFVGTEFERAGGCAGTHGSPFHPIQATLRSLEAALDTILSLPSAGCPQPGELVGATVWAGPRVPVPSTPLLTFEALNILA